MAKKHPRRLVIDADVARSAGTSEDLVSSACRLFLEIVRDVGHHVVMTRAIMEEWSTHLSRFSRKWLTQMHGKKQVYDDDVGPDKILRKRIAKTVPRNQRQAAAKDVHLIEAARGTDCLVASRDKKARGIFRSASKSVRELKPIVWVNPTLPADDPICWLRNGAQAEARRQLGFRRVMGGLSQWSGGARRVDWRSAAVRGGPSTRRRVRRPRRR